MPGPKADLDLMEDSDSDSIPSGLDDMTSDDEDEQVEDENDDDAQEISDVGSASEDVEDDDDSDDDDETAQPHADDTSSDEEPVDFGEDEDDLLDLSQLPESAFEPEDSEAVTGKRKPVEEDTRKGGRKKRRIGQLPTFASYEDYAKLIEEAPEEDL